MKNIGLGYRLPKIYKGPEIKSVPKGSTKAKEQAKQTWVIRYYVLNPSTGNLELQRITENLNYEKDPDKKLAIANSIVKSYTKLLESGWSPYSENLHLKNSMVSLTISEALDEFIDYHKSKRSRPTSIKTYLSKIKLLIEYLGQTKKVTEIRTIDLINFFLDSEKERQWSAKTFNNTKGFLHMFFNYLKDTDRIAINPFDSFKEKRKSLKSEKHQTFNDQDLKLIEDWLQDNDPYTLFSLRAIYYTCLRPNELRLLQLKHIDLVNKTITISDKISKNKKTETIEIDDNFLEELNILNIGSYNKDCFLIGDRKNIIGTAMSPAGAPYKRFLRCLAKLNLKEKGYTLYSAKHTSNVRKWKSGWSLDAIRRANRHSSIAMTEKYLRDLEKYVEPTLPIPRMVPM